MNELLTQKDMRVGFIKPKDLHATALAYLQEGNENAAANALAECAIEAGPFVQDYYNEVITVVITLRCSRAIMEQLKSKRAIQRRLIEVIAESMTSGYVLSEFVMKPRVISTSVVAEGTAATSDKGANLAARKHNMFRQAGSHWMVVFEACQEFSIPDTLGARYLNLLLH